MVVIVVWAVLHLLFGIFAIIHQTKYFKYKGLPFDNESVKFMLTYSLIFGFLCWIAFKTTFIIKDWKITNWFNKLVREK